MCGTYASAALVFQLLAHSMQTRQIDSRLEFVCVFFSPCFRIVCAFSLARWSAFGSRKTLGDASGRFSTLWISTCKMWNGFCAVWARKIDDDEYKISFIELYVFGIVLLVAATEAHPHIRARGRPLTFIWTDESARERNDGSNITFVSHIHIRRNTCISAIIPARVCLAARWMHKIDENIHLFIAGAGASHAPLRSEFHFGGAFCQHIFFFQLFGRLLFFFHSFFFCVVGGCVAFKQTNERYVMKIIMLYAYRCSEGVKEDWYVRVCGTQMSTVKCIYSQSHSLSPAAMMPFRCATVPHPCGKRLDFYLNEENKKGKRKKKRGERAKRRTYLGEWVFDGNERVLGGQCTKQ